MRYRFGEYLIDTNRRELWRGSQRLQPAPQVFDLIAYLVDHRGRVVSKNDLLHAIWHGRLVSDSALTTRINAARHILGDSGDAQRVILTLPRKGLRFVADVTPEMAGNTGSRAEQTVAAARPSIAVLPFACLTGDARLVEVAEGAAAEIVTVLSRSRWLLITARDCNFRESHQILALKHAREAIGASYLLDGLVRHSGNRLRVAVRLIDSSLGSYLWAHRFDGVFDEVFDLQDRVAAGVAGAIEPMIEIAEMRRGRERPEQELGARDLYLRASQDCYSYDARRLNRALRALEQAIDRDPGFAPALAAAAGCRQFLAVAGWADDPTTNRAKAIELARQALLADSDDPVVLIEASRVLSYFTEEIDLAMAMMERALALNPGYARGWYWSGWLNLFAGQPDVAIRSFQFALRVNPYRQSHLTGIGAAHFFSGRYDEAVDALAAASPQTPYWPTTYRFLASSCALAGKSERARHFAERLRATTSVVAPHSSGFSPFRRPQDLSRYLEGLALATGAA